MKLGSLELNHIHTLDCLQGLKLLPADCIDVVVTSPPYWGQRGDDGVGSEEDPRQYIAHLTAIFIEIGRVLKPEGVIWLNIADSYNTPINWRYEDYKYSTLGSERIGLDPSNSAYTKKRGSRKAFIDKQVGWLQYGNLLALPYRLIVNLCDHGLLYRGEVIWSKRKAMPEGKCRRPHRKHESIYIFATSEKHSFQTQPPVPSVWQLGAENNYTSHTSTFPVELPLRCIQATGIRQGVVLDPFMGSGTTAIAAMMQGWDYIGFELAPTVVQAAEARIEQYIATTANAQLTLEL